MLLSGSKSRTCLGCVMGLAGENRVEAAVQDE